ncbi:hypothetical protein AA313_de0201321 [Arthrobotrys entomopaga]|nr:hypothetical protein AA313_de0201321 [Arthrobotrys entomopaga]
MHSMLSLLFGSLNSKDGARTQHSCELVFASSSSRFDSFNLIFTLVFLEIVQRIKVGHLIFHILEICNNLLAVILMKFLLVSLYCGNHSSFCHPQYDFSLAASERVFEARSQLSLYKQAKVLQ